VRRKHLWRGGGIRRDFGREIPLSDKEELAEIDRRLDDLTVMVHLLRMTVADLLASDTIIAGVAVSLVADKFEDAKKGLDELRDRQTAAYKRLVDE
jgi:hypothetical protein